MTPGHRLNRIIREQGLINAGFAKSIGVVQYDVSILTSGASSAAGGTATPVNKALSVACPADRAEIRL